MKILVAIKRVIDYKAAIRIKSDGSGVETANVKMSMNPFDEIAVEEAVRLKEKGLASEILVISIGGDACQETLRTALAMGADRAMLVKTDQEVQPLAAAKILKSVTLQESPRLVILGKQAIDTDNNQVGQMLAALLNWPQGTFASRLEFHDQGVSVTREIDGGLETLFLDLPAVITTDLRLNEPRYISLPNIVQAKRKPLVVIPAESFNMDLAPRMQTLHVAAPEKRRSGVRLESAADLVNRLKHEAQVI
ncbi:Electron transfer flavoprotein subunit beta [Aquicella siphonis]|uniref:Electron transfer flavoprotein subunit beta n=1 Tax=Aquicella siphonis TaxID=254247 RepID=A0A5E4PM49_9COXI|nr:electron transfer flavoprotein subunit beta/FixA family protein [Aquicella siphonis]VVC77286.1 Electron transfer flavoprotein subunit beta [Aquicella siphonis]